MSAATHVSYRLAREADASAAAGIIKLALDDLAARQNRPLLSPGGDPMAPALRHVLAASPDRFWVAEVEESVIGFGAGFERGRVCYLAGLFILPSWQGKGIGGELLHRAMAGRDKRESVLAVGSSGSNLISNGLYARYGMVPLLRDSRSDRCRAGGAAGSRARVAQRRGGDDGRSP